MKDQILKLAKRINKFTLDEISTIAEMEENKVKIILDNSDVIEKSAGVYLYIPKKTKRAASFNLQCKFDYHSRETTNMIVKCFLLNIETEKTSVLVGCSQNCVVKFNRHFREIIYEAQYSELFGYYKKKPQLPRLRQFFNKIIYFYVYEDKVFISDKELYAEYESPYSLDEIRLMKMAYSKIRRRFLKAKHETNIHHYVSEAIWRDEKNFEKLSSEFSEYLMMDESGKVMNLHSQTRW